MAGFSRAIRFRRNAEVIVYEIQSSLLSDVASELSGLDFKRNVEQHDKANPSVMQSSDCRRDDENSRGHNFK